MTALTKKFYIHERMHVINCYKLTKFGSCCGDYIHVYKFDKSGVW